MYINVNKSYFEPFLKNIQKTSRFFFIWNLISFYLIPKPKFYVYSFEHKGLTDINSLTYKIILNFFSFLFYIFPNFRQGYL